MKMLLAPFPLFLWMTLKVICFKIICLHMHITALGLESKAYRFCSRLDLHSSRHCIKRKKKESNRTEYLYSVSEYYWNVDLCLPRVVSRFLSLSLHRMWYISLLILKCGAKLLFIDNSTAFSVLLYKTDKDNNWHKWLTLPCDFKYRFYNANMVCLEKNIASRILCKFEQRNLFFFFFFCKLCETSCLWIFIGITIYCTSNISLRGVNLCKSVSESLYIK